ncbi:DUF1127 domain-containing protein [Pseudomonas fulva]|uniref:DUF1127 domain-containing protein n=1 Tax=Pseudomonas fulva TaxID=47880 RepID=UPI00201D56E4|nr:DUF1127 domain-containing protein [Pseudomonas fulva]UQY34540.1 DUF1127 domain-containing protein [Pseudomonas fulva]
MDHQLCVELAGQRQPLSLVGWLKNRVARVRRWQQLASLSDAALKDLGLNRSEVFKEIQRPFWDDPLCK